jgi:hypothetical protein
MIIFLKKRGFIVHLHESYASVLTTPTQSTVGVVIISPAKNLTTLNLINVVKADISLSDKPLFLMVGSGTSKQAVRAFYKRGVNAVFNKTTDERICSNIISKLSMLNNKTSMAQQVNLIASIIAEDFEVSLQKIRFSRNCLKLEGKYELLSVKNTLVQLILEIPGVLQVNTEKFKLSREYDDFSIYQKASTVIKSLIHSGESCDFTVSKGVLVLNGEVFNRKAKINIEKCLEHIHGVKEIKNNLVVKALHTPEIETIMRKLEEKISDNFDTVDNVSITLKNDTAIVKASVFNSNIKKILEDFIIQNSPFIKVKTQLQPA